MNAVLKLWAAALAWQSRAVLWRHLRVHLRNWYTSFLPPALEPVIMLLAFGLGLGAHMGGMPAGDGKVPYASWLAPGLLAYAAFLTPFFQSLYGAFIRMHFQKTWEGQLTTQVALPHVIWGEVLWAATLGVIYTAIVGTVVGICAVAGLMPLHLAWLPIALPLAFGFGLAVSLLSLLFTAWLPSIDHMTIPTFVIALPLGFTSNTYFPLPVELPWVAVLAECNPLYHLAEGLRGLLLGGPALRHLALCLGESALAMLILLPLVQRRLQRRVLGDA